MNKQGISASVGLIFIALLVGLYMFMGQRRYRVYDEILEAIATMEEFAEDGELLTKIADRAHAAARADPRSDRGDSGYIEAFFAAILYEAHHRDRKDLKGPLQQLQNDFRHRYGDRYR
jgi:hypothetical protein